MKALSFKNWLFCRLGLLAALIAATAYADEIRTGGARVIENPTQDGNLVLRVNDGGVKKDAITVTGSTGDVVLGASGTGQTTPHVLRGYANDLVYPALRIQNEDTATAGTGVSIQFAQTAGASILSEIQSLHMGSSLTDIVFKTQNTTLVEAGRIGGAGGWTLGASSSTVQHRINGYLGLPSSTGGTPSPVGAVFLADSDSCSGAACDVVLTITLPGTSTAYYGGTINVFGNAFNGAQPIRGLFSIGGRRDLSVNCTAIGTNNIPTLNSLSCSVSGNTVTITADGSGSTASMDLEMSGMVSFVN